MSAGGFIAAGLANGMTPKQLCSAFIENDSASEDLIRPGAVHPPGLGRIRAPHWPRLPGLFVQASLRFLFKRRALLSAFEILGRALPTGLFSHAPLEAQMRRVFSAPGRSNDFRTLQRKLVLVATDLDSGEAAPFGQPGWDHVPISLAAAASAALPGLFPPVAIDGRWYVDGALKKTLHATRAARHGAGPAVLPEPAGALRRHALAPAPRAAAAATRAFRNWSTAGCRWC